jgi:hypothetical protein
MPKKKLYKAKITLTCMVLIDEGDNPQGMAIELLGEELGADLYSLNLRPEADVVDVTDVSIDHVPSSWRDEPPLGMPLGWDEKICREILKGHDNEQ